MRQAPITRAQIAKIWATARELGLDRDLLYQLVPHGSIRRLTRGEGSRLIEYLSALAEGRPLSEIRSRRGPDRATDAQHALIHGLLEEIGWTTNPARIEGFLRKHAGANAVEGITSRRRATAVIEALKAIHARAQHPDQRPAPRDRRNRPRARSPNAGRSHRSNPKRRRRAGRAPLREPGIDREEAAPTADDQGLPRITSP